MKRTYFLCPGFDYPPSSISLGYIISSPSEPSVALNINDFRPPKGVVKDIQEGVTIRREDLRQVKLGIISKFLHVIGFGIDADRADGIEDTFEFSKIDTTYYEPLEEDVQKAVQSEGVKTFLASSLFRKPLYLVTGLKIVRGASRRTTSKGFSVGNVAEGVPIDVGFGAKAARSWSKSESFGSHSDFIFAFQLRKLLVKRRWKVTGKQYSGGAIFDRDEDEDEGEDDESEDDAFEVKEAEAGVDDVPDAVAEEVFYESDDRTVVLYSADDYKGAGIH